MGYGIIIVWREIQNGKSYVEMAKVEIATVEMATVEIANVEMANVEMATVEMANVEIIYQMSTWQSYVTVMNLKLVFLMSKFSSDAMISI